MVAVTISVNIECTSGKGRGDSSCTQSETLHQQVECVRCTYRNIL